MAAVAAAAAVVAIMAAVVATVVVAARGEGGSGEGGEFGGGKGGGKEDGKEGGALPLWDGTHPKRRASIWATLAVPVAITFSSRMTGPPKTSSAPVTSALRVMVPAL